MHVLIGVDVFHDMHLQRIAGAVAGIGTWERVPHAALPAVYKDALSRADVAIGWPRAEWLAASPVRFFQLPSAGYDAYVGKGLEQKADFTLCNARGALSVAVAEHCMALMMTLVRRLPMHLRAMATKRWEPYSYDEVFGTTACVVGLGDIGTEVAKRCAALGMNVIGVRQRKQMGHPFAAPVFGPGELVEAVTGADHVFVMVPGDFSTRHLIGSAVFAAMKDGAYFYNVARGSVVEEHELIARLQSGQLQGAGLDVVADEPLTPLSPLWDMENVVITPHVAGHSNREADRLCQLFLANLARFSNRQPLLNVVNLHSQAVPHPASQSPLP